MKCAVYRHGATALATATLTVPRDVVTLVVRGVPAQVCENCGEEYVDAGEVDSVVALADATGNSVQFSSCATTRRRERRSGSTRVYGQ